MELKPLLYIIFVIIWLLYRQYSKVKGSDNKGPKPEKKSVWEEILEQIETGNEPEEVPVLKKRKHVSKKSTITPLVYESLEDLSGTSKVQTSKVMDSDEISNLDSPIYNNDLDFNLKSAIIADAILNRPYK